ncbi:D-lactate dehydrogenase [Pseudomaricurvus sp.]|uniref:D-lactate dehydrogenase n=1 Tax=Pseudomaricurvus sp. TaxID=2004510 RepID=UPI003F6A750A
MPYQSLLKALQNVVGRRHLLTSKRSTAPYRQGFREGGGPVLAVVRPSTLWQQWQLLQLCVEARVIVVMQAANTGLTGGSTPTEGCDRPTIVISTSRIDGIHVLEQQKQIIALSGASLFSLEKVLAPYGRVPHSVIGSSCIGASIVGGICNNSGGSLVQRGPAYTELALYAKVNHEGQLELVNHLDLALGDTPEEILKRLQSGDFTEEDIKTSTKKASDQEYSEWVRHIHSDSPARFNADPRRLHEASGCAGKLAVFAVRMDTFLQEGEDHTLYLGTNSTATMEAVRRNILEKARNLPVSAEYLHREVFELSDRYGRDTVLMIQTFGTDYLPAFFKLKRQLTQLLIALPWIKSNLVDKAIYRIANWFPSQVSPRLHEYNQRFEHQLILTIKAHDLKDIQDILTPLEQQSDLHTLLCDSEESRSAYLLRFSAAGAAIQYAQINKDEIEGLIALDIALKRSEPQWQEQLPESLASKLAHTLYYGHFFCHVFHQDYLVKKGEDLTAVKEALLTLQNERGAEYPAEHNVGHQYHAKPTLAENYRQLDPTNSLNAGIGKMSKRWLYR